jgi:predicted branched-subunit amino acid permease
MIRSMHRGAVANMSLALSAVTYGGVLGVLSSQQGTSWLEVLFMDVCMFAGSAQFVMIEMWQTPLPILQIALAVFIVNLR